MGVEGSRENLRENGGRAEGIQRRVDRMEDIARRGKTCEQVLHVCKWAEGKENQQVNKTVGEGINVGKRLRALKEWDQNRIVQPQEKKLATVKGGTWKRKSTPACEIMRSTFGGGGDKVEHETGTTGKHKFCLVDEHDAIESFDQNGKKCRMSQDDMYMVDIAVKEASHNLPQIDQ